MAKLNTEEVVRNYVNSVKKLSAARSEECLGEVHPAFVLGYTRRELRIILSQLNLTQKQLKILSENIL